MIPVLAVSATTASVSAALPSVLNGLPTAAAVGALCVAVIVEIVAVLLPGGTVTLLAGALIGAGRPAFAVAIPMIIAVLGADQLAFLGGAAVIDWWRRRTAEAAEDEVSRRGRAATWLTASMPSIAGAARMPYRSFAVRMAIMRVPWLAAALSAGTLAAKSLAEIGHVAGIAGLIASAVVVTGFFIVRHRPAAIRVLARRTAAIKRRLSTTLM